MHIFTYEYTFLFWILYDTSERCVRIRSTHLSMSLLKCFLHTQPHFESYLRHYLWAFDVPEHPCLIHHKHPLHPLYAFIHASLLTHRESISNKPQASLFSLQYCLLAGSAEIFSVFWVHFPIQEYCTCTAQCGSRLILASLLQSHKHWRQGTEILSAEWQNIPQLQQ